MNYYSAEAMKQAGCYLIGCNQLFEKIPFLDYLVFQDSNVIPHCLKWPGPKLMCNRKVRHREFHQYMDYKSLIFYTNGRYREKNHGNTMESSNSGCLAFQLAHLLGFKTIILVGCDCEFIDEKDDGDYRSNIFKDKQVIRTIQRERRRKNNKKHLDQVTVNGKIKFTNNILLKFAHKFEELYRRFKYDTNIFKMGEWGILNVPSVDFVEFYSDDHPTKHG